MTKSKKALEAQGDKADAKTKEESDKLIKELQDLIDKKDIPTLKAKLEEVENMMKNFANFAQQANATKDQSSKDQEEVATVVEE